ncbi:hypothetical protein V8G54_007810 [Vigna mungo]|uniref:Uncharacterized protein n=1 Tax=Vigna mungo TaxID=3915 RepID=A0AAQ3P2Z8_VIGMU
MMLDQKYCFIISQMHHLYALRLSTALTTTQDTMVRKLEVGAEVKSFVVVVTESGRWISRSRDFEKVALGRAEERGENGIMNNLYGIWLLEKIHHRHCKGCSASTKKELSTFLSLLLAVDTLRADEDLFRKTDLMKIFSIKLAGGDLQ